MRRFDRINLVLPDNLMVKIFWYLESKRNREAFSLVCKRWLNLERLSREIIHISFTDGTDALLKLLTNRYVNVHDVSIDEFPRTSLAPKPKRVGIFSFLDRLMKNFFRSIFFYFILLGFVLLCEFQ